MLASTPESIRTTPPISFLLIILQERHPATETKATRQFISARSPPPVSRAPSVAQYRKADIKDGAVVPRRRHTRSPSIILMKNPFFPVGFFSPGTGAASPLPFFRRSSK
ncbi:hypothetical protein GWI33_015202 [Rhynchophorus ferrugineus]|uniref:Uncharacterized protein n=1 Tax=Rhynchophorus ferrugineus TaxID=354439 RepID=A0A834M8B1_RHYFE|nr:hypothetical protein GWI33_015202 [Rhynchophorus ferrugineus]